MYPLPFYEGDRFRRRQIADNTQGTSTDSTASSHTPFDWSAVLNHGGPPSTLSWTAIVKYATAQKQLSDSPSPQGSNQQHGQQSGPSALAVDPNATPALNPHGSQGSTNLTSNAVILSAVPESKPPGSVSENHKGQVGSNTTAAQSGDHSTQTSHGPNYFKNPDLMDPALIDSTKPTFSKGSIAAVTVCTFAMAVLLGFALYRIWRGHRPLPLPNTTEKKDNGGATVHTRRVESDLFGGREHTSADFAPRGAAVMEQHRVTSTYRTESQYSQPHSFGHKKSDEAPPMPIQVKIPKAGELEKQTGEKKQEAMGGGYDVASTFSGPAGRVSEAAESSMFHDSSMAGKLCIVTRTFEPALPDELMIHPGDRVQVDVVYDDGWCLGRNLDAAHHGRPGEELPIDKGVFPRECLGTSDDQVRLQDKNAGKFSEYSQVSSGHHLNFSMGGFDGDMKEDCLDTIHSSHEGVTDDEPPLPSDATPLRRPMNESDNKVEDRPHRTTSLVADNSIFAELDKALGL